MSMQDTIHTFCIKGNFPQLALEHFGEKLFISLTFFFLQKKDTLFNFSCRDLNKCIHKKKTPESRRLGKFALKHNVDVCKSNK